MTNKSQDGFIHILVLVAVLAGAGFIASANTRITKEFPANINQSVLGEEKTKVQTEGKKIKAKVEDDGSIKVEFEEKKLKLKYVTENGKVKVEAEDEASDEAKISEKELENAQNELENELEKDGIKIGTQSGETIITKNNFSTLTRFPLSINPDTRQLTVNTPAGSKVVAVLPDQAIQNMLTNNIFNKIATSSGSFKLETKGDELVYEVNGEKTYKILGLVPVVTSSTAFVSAQSGKVVAQNQSLLTSFINLLSF